MENQVNNKKKIGKIISASVTAVLILTVVLCLFVVVQVLSKGYVTIGGKSFFKVVTGSMEPNLMIGELIMTDDVCIDDLQLGDVISFRSQAADMYGVVITHRVVDIDKSSEGKTVLLTKGDNNLSADGGYVYESNYVGKVVWSSGSSAFSSVFSFISGSYGFFACIVFPSILIFGFLLSNSIKNIKRDMKKLIETEELQKEKVKSEQSQQNSESYEEMCLRIKQELIEELKASEETTQPKTE